MVLAAAPAHNPSSNAEALHAPGSERMALTILSWNCNGGDLQNLRDFVFANSIDIVVLQEAPKTIRASAMKSLLVGHKGAYTDDYANEYDPPLLNGSYLDGNFASRWNYIPVKN